MRTAMAGALALALAPAADAELPRRDPDGDKLALAAGGQWLLAQRIAGLEPASDDHRLFLRVWHHAFGLFRLGSYAVGDAIALFDRGLRRFPEDAALALAEVLHRMGERSASAATLAEAIEDRGHPAPPTRSGRTTSETGRSRSGSSPP